MKKAIGILVLGLLWCNVGFANGKLFAECKYFVDKTLEGESGKFKKIKPEFKEENIKVNVVKKIDDKNYEGYINGAGHKDRKLILKIRPKMVEIIQRDSRNLNYTAIYTIFNNHKSNKGGFLSSMNENSVSNFGQVDISYYRGYCKLNT
jgi:hypothetical protein